MNRVLIVLFIVACAIVGGLLARARMGMDPSSNPPEPVIIDGLSRHVVTPEMARASLARRGAPAPPFATVATDGSTHRLEEMLRHGPVILIFIKDGCPCSEAAQPFFNAIHAAYPDAAIRGVINLEATAAQRWANRQNVQYPLLLDPQESLVRAYGAENSAHVVLIDESGRIVRHWPGYSDAMLRELGALIATMTGSPERPLDLLDAPSELYTGCPYDR